MPMKFTVSKDDLLRAKLVTPGWYLCTITGVTQGPGKNDPSSTTTTIKLTIKDGPDKTCVGVPVDYWLSEKAPGLALSFMQALTGRKLPDTGVEVDLEQARGKDIRVYIKNDKYLNRLTNRAEDFQTAT